MEFLALVIILCLVKGLRRQTADITLLSKEVERFEKEK